MRIIWTIVPLILFSAVGIQDSEAKECYEFSSLFEDNTGRIALKATVLSSGVEPLDPPLQAYDEEFSSKLVTEFKIDDQIYGKPVFDLDRILIDEYFQSEPYEVGEQKIVTQFYAEVKDFEQRWWPFACYPVYDLEYEDYTNWIVGLEKDSSFEYDNEKHSFENYLEIQLVNDMQSTESKNVNEVFQSPLQQLNSGVSPNEIECKPEMVLVLNYYDSRPACVTESGADRLESRGWGIRA